MLTALWPSKGIDMDDANSKPSQSSTSSTSRGLRLVASEGHLTSAAPNLALHKKPKLKSPLLIQLERLAGSLEAEVEMIMKL